MKKAFPSIQYLVAGIAVYLFIPDIVSAQALDPVSFHIDPEQIAGPVVAGSAFPVTVDAVIEDGWHLYSLLNPPDAGPIPTMFASEGDELIIAGDITESPAETAYDPNFDANLGWHSQKVTFSIPVLFDPGLQGQQNVALKVTYQACDDVSCLLPVSKLVRAEVMLEAATGMVNNMAKGSGDFGRGTQQDKVAGGAGHSRNLYVFWIVLLLSGGVAALVWGRRYRRSGRSVSG